MNTQLPPNKSNPHPPKLTTIPDKSNTPICKPITIPFPANPFLANERKTIFEEEQKNIFEEEQKPKQQRCLNVREHRFNFPCVPGSNWSASSDPTGRKKKARSVAIVQKNLSYFIAMPWAIDSVVTLRETIWERMAMGTVGWPCCFFGEGWRKVIIGCIHVQQLGVFYLELAVWY